jgi:hypothetical protein
MDKATDRNVYLLGAGFSHPAGAPLIYDFLERSRQYMNNRPAELDDFGMEHFHRVFAFKQEMAKAREKISVDLDNIEDLFGLVEMSCRLGITTTDTRDSMIYVIAKTLELCTIPRRPRGNIGFQLNRERAPNLTFEQDFVRHDKTNRKYFVDLYDFFAMLLEGAFDDPNTASARSDAVITFNYDLVLDDALFRTGFRPWYGHSIDRTDGNIPLLKLHGSANWAVCPDCGEPAVFPEKLTRSFSELTTIPCGKCGKRQCQPLLIPPSWDKTDHRNTMRPVWKTAVDELRRATRICIIGYSMPESDAFFRYLLTVALSENHQLEKLVVVDYTGLSRISFEPVTIPPRKSEIEEKWIKLLDGTFRQRRFTFFGDGFENFIAQRWHEMGRGALLDNVGRFGG